MSFYKELLMDHYRNPRNREKLDNPDFSTKQLNPSCGDSISMQGNVEDGVLSKLAFEGKGCVVNLATASILTEYCIGKTLDDLLVIDKDELSDIIGMQLGVTRIKCALLPLVAIKEGILGYRKK